MFIRILATGLTAVVALFCSVPTEAAVINASDFTDGLSNQTIQGIDFTASGGTFAHKNIAGIIGVGVSGGPSGEEIDLSQSITGTALSFNIGSITIGFLFDGPEFADVNEVAQITVDGTAYLLKAVFTGPAGVTATWTGPGAVSNLSPAIDPGGAATWLLSGLNLTDVQSISFIPIPGSCVPPDGFPNGGACTNQSDFSLVQLDTSVPEPGTLALLGIGLVGLGFARRRKAAKPTSDIREANGGSLAGAALLNP